MMVKKVLLLLLTVTYLADYSAQSDICNEWTLQERREMAVEWRDAIAESGLVVVMESNNRQINYLETQLNANQIKSEKRKNKLRKELEELRAETISKAEETIVAFNENFDFSAVYFIWDNDMRYILRQSDTAVFLADDLTYLDSSPYQAADEIYFLIRGRADRSSGRSGMEGFIIRNKELNPLCTPFPYFLSRNDNNFFNAIFSIFSPDLYGEREMSQVAERFNRRLHGF